VVTRFSATTESEAVVAADRAAIWEVLTDPVLLPRLTPLLRHVEPAGDLWRWELTKVPVLGIAVTPSFTERMSFVPTEHIEYAHEPPAGSHERTGADGWYRLSDVAGGTHLAISLTFHVDLPLARLARPAVEQVMRTTMARTGDRFAVNLERHLGLR
jgi:carbon monoxide dehydrogenase subunit G